MSSIEETLHQAAGQGTPGEPVQIYPNFFKLYVLAGIFAFIAAICLKGAVTGGSAVASAILAVLAIAMGYAASRVWMRAGRRTPFLVVGPEGIDDARYGFIPWTQIKRWRHSKSILNPGFGWDLAPGVRPPRNAALFRLAKAVNMLSGIGQRTYRKQMVLGGLAPVADAFRAFRPDLEAK